ncbi:hypothetical protein [Variovorax paradoxus]|uniref:hypothetical protein n=1 Tax=Variovorax paradoxus TaxID=34073 RepID=UPI0012D3E054|nr:hypothetical protein [Variovorax paradoxus]
MNSVNLNYIRGLYNFLFEKNDEELEDFDLNLHENQKILFEEMARSFEGFGPNSKRNVIIGLNLIFRSAFDENLWRSAVPHDLPLIEVTDRRAYLERLIFAITNNAPMFFDERDFYLIDEVGSHGLDFSK